METLLSLPTDWSNASEQLREALATAGLQVTQSFDLQTARAALADPSCCPCPYHGTTECTCQYLVLLVSHQDVPPMSLVLHGHDDWTHISLSKSTNGAADEETEKRVRIALKKLAAETTHRPH